MDLLLERDRKIIAVECKIREQPQRKDLQGIDRLRKFYGEGEVPKACVACPTDVPFDLQGGITAVSGWEAWPLGWVSSNPDKTEDSENDTSVFGGRSPV